MEKLSTLGYSVVQGIKNIKRNRMFSIASIITITACLFLFGIFYFMVSNVQYMIKNIENAVSITVFFDEGITDARVEEMRVALETKPEVKEVIYVSAEEAWEKFKTDIFDEQEELISTFEEDNPLADSASFEITVTDIAKQGKLVKEIEGIDGVRKVNSSDETAKTLTNFNHLVSTASLFIIVILLVVSVFLISTTISVGISVRREEIAIMRLIGATDFFVQGPFIVEGILIGLIGALIPMGILVVIYFQLIHWLTEKFASLSDWLVFLSIGQECAVLLPVCLLIGIGIGLLGSCITVKKHLQV